MKTTAGARLFAKLNRARTSFEDSPTHLLVKEDAEIEKKVADSIKESIGDDLRRKVREIQDTITGKIDRRLRDLEDRFDIKHSTLQLEAVQTARKHAAEAKDQTLKEIASQGGGWFWPFFILFLIVTCGGGLMFRHFKRLHEKSHLF